VVRVSRRPFVPDRGDVIWLDFDPQAGHEQAGRRPALVLSPANYNGLTGLALLCPITNQAKGYSFEVALPPGYAVTGVVLADQVKSQDWRKRQAKYVARLPEDLIAEVLQLIDALLYPG
jgi:mRNA interferase MazF